MRQLHAIIYGRVQGVSFRYNAQSEAQGLGLVGWVRNLEDRTVETLAQGLPGRLEAYAQWLHHGPSGAYVTRIEMTWDDAPDNLETFRNFEIR